MTESLQTFLMAIGGERTGSASADWLESVDPFTGQPWAKIPRGNAADAPLLGALAFPGLEEILKGFTDHWAAIYGLLIVVMTLVWRDGLTGLLQRLDRLRPSQAPASATPLASTEAVEGNR